MNKIEPRFPRATAVYPGEPPTPTPTLGGGASRLPLVINEDDFQRAVYRWEEEGFRTKQGSREMACTFRCSPTTALRYAEKLDALGLATFVLGTGSVNQEDRIPSTLAPTDRLAGPRADRGPLTSKEAQEWKVGTYLAEREGEAVKTSTLLAVSGMDRRSLNRYLNELKKIGAVDSPSKGRWRKRAFESRSLPAAENPIVKDIMARDAQERERRENEEQKERERLEGMADLRRRHGPILTRYSGAACKALDSDGNWACERRTRLDGYCMDHHPDHGGE